MNLSSSRKTFESLPQLHQDGRSKRVLLVGATGFIGSRILRAFDSQSDTTVSILSRGHYNGVGSYDNSVISGDVTDFFGLSLAMEGIDVVINAASYVGPDAESAMRVNLEGTRNILRACEQSSVSRVIQLSTTAVYGSGPHRGPKPSAPDYHPESAVSQTRATADQDVLAAGGIVVRPNLVYGSGDRWVIPGIVRMFSTLEATIDHGDALVSLIDVEALGRLAASLAKTSRPISGALHAAGTEPVSVRNLLRHISEQIQKLDIKRDCSLPEAIRLLEPAGFRPHQVSMLGADHYYDSSELWEIAGLAAPAFRISPDASLWYRRLLAGH
ncbi:NAD(P)-dependent oxidoreductase [Paenarthrobacter sp. OM7]|uniref:NAD-dependent epimerase/dehydratase family protein n=1 Tax=Paenarthrobacter sp. OM7 TaxID=3041264 RepID=UPI002469956A|nr:NAD(P)-dependent oxidoreductase [Paenarthrobacter sp. OM7]WGM18767.1 NAD(P)-dependent oxidoreductase [Paenarthrobacter sp. OM7]